MKLFNYFPSSFLSALPTPQRNSLVIASALFSLHLSNAMTMFAASGNDNATRYNNDNTIMMMMTNDDGKHWKIVPTAFILGGPEYFISKVIKLINFP